MTQERTKLLRPLMLDAFKGAWGVVILTYPPEARAAVRQARLLRRARKVALHLVEEWVLQANGLSAGDGWRLGLCSVEHPEGDKRPREWLPHHNVLFPQVAFGPDGERMELRYHVDPAELVTLRAWWRWLLESIVLGRRLGRDANVKYSFRKEEKKKKHAARYYARGFYSWGWRGQRITWFGAFGCNVVNELPEVKQLAEPPLNERGWCPICGCEIVGRVDAEAHPVPIRYRAITGGSSP